MAVRLMDKRETAEYVETLPEVTDACSTHRREEAIKDLKNHYYYVVVENGDEKAVISFDKPRISRDLWYDDETPDPMAPGCDKKQVFVNYNLSLNFRDYGFRSWLKSNDYLDDPYDGPRPPYVYVRDYRPQSLHVHHRRTETSNEEWFHYLDRDELETLDGIIDQLEEAYIKRLDSYYKRYSDKIYSRGYWANH